MTMQEHRRRLLEKERTCVADRGHLYPQRTTTNPPAATARADAARADASGTGMRGAVALREEKARVQAYAEEEEALTRRLRELESQRMKARRSTVDFVETRRATAGGPEQSGGAPLGAGAPLGKLGNSKVGDLADELNALSRSIDEGLAAINSKGRHGGARGGGIDPSTPFRMPDAAASRVAFRGAEARYDPSFGATVADRSGGLPISNLTSPAFADRSDLDVLMEGLRADAR
jgi:hypothetical protein